MLAVLAVPFRTCLSTESMLETSGTTFKAMLLFEVMCGVTSKMVARFVVVISAEEGMLAAPGVILKMGKARVTASVAFLLSSVTVRGVERTSVSLSLLRKESTALTPSAFKNAVAG